MENWKITREDAIDWGATLLLALPLCFFALANWPQQPEGTLACYLREWGTAGIVLLCYIAVRGVRVWRQNATQRRQSLRAGGLELLVGSTYFAVVAAGGALLWAFDRFVLMPQSFWLRFAVVVPLGFPLLFGIMLLGLWAGSYVKGRVSPADALRITVRPLRVPDAEQRAQFEPPLRLRRRDRWLCWLAVPCALLSVGAWTGFATALAQNKEGDAVFIAAFALWIGIGALFMGTQALPHGRIGAGRLRSRWRRAVSWREVAVIEEVHSRHLLGVAETRALHFQNARGQSLWQLPVDEVHPDDLRRLQQLLPDL